jgi:hypothetical protein
MIDKQAFLLGYAMEKRSEEPTGFEQGIKSLWNKMTTNPFKGNDNTVDPMDRIANDLPLPPMAMRTAENTAEKSMQRSTWDKMFPWMALLGANAKDSINTSHRASGLSEFLMNTRKPNLDFTPRMRR